MASKTAAEAGGHFAENIAYFARALRAAGLKIGPGAVLDAVCAVETIGIGHRDEFRAALQAVFVKKRADAEVFDQAFRLFWRRRALLEKLMATMMPVAPGNPNDKRQNALRRVSEALFAERAPEDAPPKREADLDSRLTTSDIEVFRARDFEQMSAAELGEAKKAIARLRLPPHTVKTRRFIAHPHGSRFDPRASLRASLRLGGDDIALRFREPAELAPPLVALCDISGSMSQYSRLFLHFLHLLAGQGRRVHAFTFATELTNVTRAIRSTKDPDLALAACAAEVRDWDGGTRIGTTLERFNKLWARRVLGGGAVVLLVSDGLEREIGPDLSRETARLHRSCRRLVWLNPLLRYDAFAAKAAGIRAMLPHVDEFRSIHNLASMDDLVAALSASRSDAANPRRFLREAA